MPKSAAVIAAIIQTMPQPIVVLDATGAVALANSPACVKAGFLVGAPFANQAVDLNKARMFFQLCHSTTTPLPTRLELKSGFDCIAFGHRLAVPDTGIDGAVMIRFDEGLSLSSKFASLNDDIASLTNKIRYFGREKTHLENLALTDALTEVYNRRGFDQELEKEFSRSSRYDHTFCVALIDLDHFKLINDAHGHQLGDEILVHFANRCLEHVRQTDVFCRIGGEEFALILPETGLGPAGGVVTRMLNLINETPLISGGKRYPYTASAGLSVVQRGDTPESLFLRADKNLYAAKDAGRACVVKDGEYEEFASQADTAYATGA
ncbi:GGDEF domain-containing protein [Roseibium sp. M-1]